MITSVFIDHPGRIPTFAKILNISEETLTKSFNEAKTAGRYCRIKCELTDEQSRAIRAMFKL